MGIFRFLAMDSESSVKLVDKSLDDWGHQWDTGETGWHRQEVNTTLMTHFDLFVNGRKDIKVFVPLCGKTKDMKWILDQGHRVVGLEFHEPTVRELFAEANIPITEIKQCGDLKLYSGENDRFKCYQGDLFSFQNEFENELIDGIWDRGSLVAVNKEDRVRYVALMRSIMSPSCRYLLESYDYDEHEWNRTPHAFTHAKLVKLFGPELDLSLLETRDGLDKWKDAGLTRFDLQAHLITFTNK